jgi:hypothetical protein
VKKREIALFVMRWWTANHRALGACLAACLAEATVSAKQALSAPECRLFRGDSHCWLLTDTAWMPSIAEVLRSNYEASVSCAIVNSRPPNAESSRKDTGEPPGPPWVVDSAATGVLPIEQVHFMRAPTSGILGTQPSQPAIRIHTGHIHGCRITCRVR